MLTVICGEDTASSRTYLLTLKASLTQKDVLIQTVQAAALEDVYKNSEGVVSLFGQSEAYFVEKLSAAVVGRKKTRIAEILPELIKNPLLTIVDWEEGKSAYELTTLKKLATEFKEFKPEKSIFQLLDSCFPTNLRSFLQAIDTVRKTQDDTFIFAMLCKHVRGLILAKENALDAKISPWQKKNLLTQSKFWSTEKLVGFYEGLARIDVALKTSATPFDVKNSLDILACYYL